MLDWLQVLNMEKLIKPKLEEEKRKQLDTLRKEATDTAIVTVKTKLREELEAQKAALLESSNIIFAFF